MTKGIPEPKNDRQGFSVIKIKTILDVMFALMTAEWLQMRQKLRPMI